MVENTNALVKETERARAEAAAKFQNDKYWEMTADPDAYDPTSPAEQLRRLNEYRAFLAEQRDKNLRSIQAGESPVLARQESTKEKAATEDTRRQEWWRKEREKTDDLVDKIAAVDAEIARMRGKAHW